MKSHLVFSLSSLSLASFFEAYGILSTELAVVLCVLCLVYLTPFVLSALKKNKAKPMQGQSIDLDEIKNQIIAQGNHQAITGELLTKLMDKVDHLTKSAGFPKLP